MVGIEAWYRSVCVERVSEFRWRGSSRAGGADRRLALAWGYNAESQLGLGGTNSESSPKQVFPEERWVAVAGGLGHSVAIQADGCLWAWGWNGSGQLGAGDLDERLESVQVGIDRDWFAVSAGADHSLALKTNGTLWAWGSSWGGRKTIARGIHAAAR